jgi:phosphatidylserine/phosphatidylglycerophosphate/cardiolipin synthase-like enzyme
MQRVLQGSTRAVRPKSMQLYTNAPRSFGTTHFIVGQKNPSQSLTPVIGSEHIKVNALPFIINGSSTHLIDESRPTQAFFTTVHDIRSILLKMLNDSKESIAISAFSLTDKDIANALIAAQKRGVDVSVIMDSGKMKERYSKSQTLLNNDIPVWCYDCGLRPGYKKKDWAEPLMHHKCMVIDDVVITGSANATKAAQNDNIENINILRDPHTVEEHRQEFTRLKKFCVECKK